GELDSQIVEYLLIAREPGAGENGFDDFGDCVAVAAVLHLRDRGTDRKQHAAPDTRPDRIGESAIETHPEVRDKGPAHETNGKVREPGPAAGPPDLCSADRIVRGFDAGLPSVTRHTVSPQLKHRSYRV